MTQEDGDPPGAEVVEAFVTVSRALVAIAVRSVEASPVPVTVPQQRVLVLLASHGPQTVAAVGEHLAVDQSNASRACSRLDRLGLVTRRRDTGDARVVRVALTPSGRHVLAEIGAARRREIAGVLDEVLPTMQEDEVAAARTLLTAFNHTAREVDESDWPW